MDGGPDQTPLKTLDRVDTIWLLVEVRMFESGGTVPLLPHWASSALCLEWQLTRYLTLAWGVWAETTSDRTAPTTSEGAREDAREMAWGQESAPWGEELSEPGRETERIV